MPKSNSANPDLSIEVRFIALVLLEPNFLKISLEKASFYAFFRYYATGSGRKGPEMPKFNSANPELSIEVRFIAVASFFGLFITLQ